MSQTKSHPAMPSGPLTFPPEHIAAACAWPGILGGLVPWRVFYDAVEDCGHEFITVDPPFAEGAGFHVTQDLESVIIMGPSGRQLARAKDLIDAMQKIAPLSEADLTYVQIEAAASIALPVGPPK